MTTGIRWLSVGPGSGLGDASEAYIAGLRTADVPVSWTPLGWPSVAWNAKYGPITVDIPIPHDTIVVCSTPLWHEQLAVEADGRQLVALTTWETDRLPAESVAILNRYDRVLVPSQFNAGVFASSGVTTPLEVVPHIARRPRPQTPPPDGDKFVFYLIATWTTRKAILDAVSAYLAAFTAADDVLLRIHATPEDLIARARVARGERKSRADPAATWFTLANALAGRANAPEISLSTDKLTRDEIDAFHIDGECFVSLSRGEGWGLCAFDAAAFGNPVVVTGWGGTREFLPGSYPYAVDYDLVPTTSDEADEWWHPRPGEHWAKARIEHAAELLRDVFEHRDAAREWGRSLQAKVTDQFAEPDVTRRLIDALSGARGLSSSAGSARPRAG
jgi:glycosyltransferase involved in cell wall biosynthesis